MGCVAAGAAGGIRWRWHHPPNAVTGSPCGTNFYRVEGPLLPPGGVQTNLFTVVGKKIDVCGNGILDVGEQCDDGNKLNGDCCSSVCKFEALGSPCTAATICTNNACNGAGSCGFASLNNGIACTDGNVCTVGDTCTAICQSDACTQEAGFATFIGSGTQAAGFATFIGSGTQAAAFATFIGSGTA